MPLIGIPALACLLAALSTATASCSSWCNAFTCGLSSCAGCAVCDALAGRRACAAYCNVYLCDSDERCAGCEECRGPVGEQCEDYCNVHTCSHAKCVGCDVCATRGSGQYCAWWCAPPYTCYAPFALCAGCTGCEAVAAATATATREAEQAQWERDANAMIDAVAKVAFKPDGTLDIADETLRSSLKGYCLHRDNYTIATRDGKWQCDESDRLRKRNFRLATGSVYQGIPYTPQPTVRQMLADFAGIDRSAVDRLMILSALSEDDATPVDRQDSTGQWCGMPIPPNSASNGKNVTEYWSKCVTPHAGYFNVLQCDKGPQDDNESRYAVLGLAALNQGVCYPAHHHYASEMYWQVGGRAMWRTWDGCANGTYGYVESDPSVCVLRANSSTAGPYGMESNPDAWRGADGNYIAGLGGRNQPPLLPHEIDTTEATNGPNKGALMVYFWGLMSEYATENAYQSTHGQFTSPPEAVYDPYLTGSCAYNLDSGSMLPPPGSTVCPASLSTYTIA